MYRRLIWRCFVRLSLSEDSTLSVANSSVLKIFMTRHYTFTKKGKGYSVSHRFFWPNGHGPMPLNYTPLSGNYQTQVNWLLYWLIMSFIPSCRRRNSSASSRCNDPSGGWPWGSVGRHSPFSTTTSCTSTTVHARKQTNQRKQNGVEQNGVRLTKIDSQLYSKTTSYFQIVRYISFNKLICWKSFPRLCV